MKTLILLVTIWAACGLISWRTKDNDSLVLAGAMTFFVGLGYFLLHLH